MQFFVGFVSHERWREWILLGRAVTRKDNISEKCGEYLPPATLHPSIPSTPSVSLRSFSSDQIRSWRVSVIPQGPRNMLFLKPKGAHCKFQGAPMTHKSNKWLRNSLKKSGEIKTNKQKRRITSRIGTVLPRPTFHCWWMLSLPLLSPPCLLLSSFLILPLISYTSSFLFRQQKQVFHLQHFFIPQMNVDLF